MSEAPNLLRQADVLKETILDTKKNVSDVCVSRQRLEDMYKRVLLLDLEYALDRKVEQDLWNNCFKNQITALQSQAKDRQNVKRTEAQASLTLFLEMASGFYQQLIQAMCDAFKLDLPFRRKSCIYGILNEEGRFEGEVKTPKKCSSLYIAQYCLVHMGDIARYRQQVGQAETYYWHAAFLIPVNGQPYNQLAIVEAARGNRLSTVFYHVRSLALRCPFSVAATNLEKLYVKVTKERCDYKEKLSYTDFVNAFLQFHGLIHLSGDVKTVSQLSDRLLASLPAHINSAALTSNTLLQMVAITLYTLHNVRHGVATDPVGREQLDPEEQQHSKLLFAFIASVLEILLAHTPKTETKARDFSTLPTIKIILDWLQLNVHYFSHPLIKSSTMWPHFAKLLNCVQGKGDDWLREESSKTNAEIVFLEDVMLRGFQPLEKVQSLTGYSRWLGERVDAGQETRSRCRHLVSYGLWLTHNHSNLLSIKDERNGRRVFASPIPTVTFSADSPSPEKHARQNVAMQAIMQNKQTSPETTPSTSDTSLAESEGSSPDRSHSSYLLGTLMNDADSRKTSRSANPAPSLFNAKTPVAGKNSPETSGVTPGPKKPSTSDDQPIQTSCQNPGLIQIATKDIEKIEKSAALNTGKPMTGAKYYRNIAPRHRNRVPDSLQHSQLERQMEEKPFCANKESWPALSTKDANAEFVEPKLTNLSSEQQQILRSLSQPAFPVGNIAMPGLNIVRYPVQSGPLKSAPGVETAATDGSSHRYSRMNRGEPHTAPPDAHRSDEFHQSEYRMDSSSVEYTSHDTNNSNNLQHLATAHLPMPNSMIISHQPSTIHQQTNSIQPPNMQQQFSFPSQMPFLQPHDRVPYPDLRPQIVTTPIHPSFPINPLTHQLPQQTPPDNQPTYQQYQPPEFSRQLPTKPLTTMTQFMDSARPGIFPSMDFMLNNPPPNVVATGNAHKAPHMRVYSMEGQTQLQNGEALAANSNPISHPHYGAAVTRQTSQGDAEKAGTYSLFSGGPWSVQISSAGDSKAALGTSFLSAGSMLDAENVPKGGKQAPYRGTEWGPTVQEAAGLVTNQNINAGMQSLWTMPGPSPLQRLLEQQRQQRQNDPH